MEKHSTFTNLASICGIIAIVVPAVFWIANLSQKVNNLSKKINGVEFEKISDLEQKLEKKINSLNTKIPSLNSRENIKRSFDNFDDKLSNINKLEQSFELISAEILGIQKRVTFLDQRAFQ